MDFERHINVGTSLIKERKKKYADSDIDHRKVYACVQVGSTREISVSSHQFCCE